MNSMTRQKTLPFPPAFPLTLRAFDQRMETPLILPHNTLPSVGDLDFKLYVSFIEQLVKHILPFDILQELSCEKTSFPAKQTIARLNGLLPIMIWNEPATAPCIASCILLCPSDFTSGIGRHFCDSLSRWLVPGKFLNICSAQSLNFRFWAFREQFYFIQQVLLDIYDERELAVAKSNWEHLSKEIRLNILAVKHARHVVSIKKLSSDEKRVIIEESIASVIDRPSKDDRNVFDQMHHFLIKLTAEEKITQIKERFTPFMEQRPKFFDRDIFNEIKQFVILYSDKFTAYRDLRHVGRIISFHFLFRKILQKELIKAPNERHLSLKLLKVQLTEPGTQNMFKTALGLLGGINVLRENEVFEERNIFETIQHCLPGVCKIKDSFVLDRRSHDPIRLFYIEVEKLDGKDFTLEEVRGLRKRLPREIKDSIESVIHPVFMPRNEEEIMRNILILSQQLKFLHDLPQVVISFDEQTETGLSFTVIALRILKPHDLSCHAIFSSAQSKLKFESLEVRQVGLLRKKYLKEANVFKARIEKRQFLRKDHSLDLFKARQAVSCELNRLFGGIRDFNGGILSKQQEVFQEFRDSIKDSEQNNDFLLKNFFYSLTPPLRQSFLLPSVLKKLFAMLLIAIEHDYNKEPFFLKAKEEEDLILLMGASPHSNFKENVFSTITHLQISSSDLTFTYVNNYNIHCLGYIYHSHDQHQREIFYNSIRDSLTEGFARWEK